MESMKNPFAGSMLVFRSVRHFREPGGALGNINWMLGRFCRSAEHWALNGACYGFLRGLTGDTKWTY